jgi:hypothetical protein
MLQRFERPLKISLLVSTLVAAAALPQAALIREAKAETAEKRKVAVGGFEGAKSGSARSAFIDALKSDGSYEVTDAEDVKPSAKAPAVAEAAKGLGVHVIITGKVAKGGLKLKVMNGTDGSVLEEVEVKGAGGKLKGNIEKSGASAVAAAISAATVEEKPEEPPAEEPASEEAESEATAEVSAAPSGEGLSPFDATAGLRPVHRTFEFNDTIADARPGQGFYQLLKYELPLGPALFIDVNWYPGSHFTTGAAEWFGITAGYEKGFATSSVYREGTPSEETYKTDTQAWYAGGRFRFPLGQHQLGLSGTYGQHTFVLEGDTANPLIPDVKYSHARVLLDGTFRFGDFLAGAHVGKRFVFDTGAMESVWFPNVKADSLEAGVMVGYRLVSMLDLVAGFDWLRYAFDFNPVPMRPENLRSFVAGGAVDEYLVGHIAFRFHLPGKGEAAAAAAPATE